VLATWGLGRKGLLKMPEIVGRRNGTVSLRLIMSLSGMLL